MPVILYRATIGRRLLGSDRFFTACSRQQAQKRPPPLTDYCKSAPPLAPVQKSPLPIQVPPTEVVDPKDARFGARDPARGLEATLKVAQGGKLDPRYRPAARRVLAIIVSLPIVIALGYELFQRRFRGKEKKRVAG